MTDPISTELSQLLLSPRNQPLQTLQQASSTDSGYSTASLAMTVSEDVEMVPAPSFATIGNLGLVKLLVRSLDDQQILILDCRNFSEYNNCHIRRSVNTFYSKLQRKRFLTCKDQFEKFIEVQRKNLLDEVTNDHRSLRLVIFSTESCAPRATTHCAVATPRCRAAAPLREANTNPSVVGFDVGNCQKFCQTLFEKLQSGEINFRCDSVWLYEGPFEEFRHQFPHFCESSPRNDGSSNGFGGGVSSPLTAAAPLTAPIMDFQTGDGSSGTRRGVSAAGGEAEGSLAMRRSAQAPFCLSARPSTSRFSLPTSISQPAKLASLVACHEDFTASTANPVSDGPTQILDFLYLGSQQDASNIQVIERLNIKRVINISENGEKPANIPDSAKTFLRIPIKDSYAAKLLPFFETAFEFLDEARRKGETVLIHCLAGISRSATLAIAYVMRHNRMSSDEAYKFVKTRRTSISPNFNFMGQLLEYEKQLRERGLIPASGNRPASYTEPGVQLLQKHTELQNTGITKSPSCDFVLLTPRRINENGKRTMDMPLAFPERPRQLIKMKQSSSSSASSSSSSSSSGFSRRVLAGDSSSSTDSELPSPSTEFKKLDISNPLVSGLPPIPSDMMPSPMSICVENPMFGVDTEALCRATTVSVTATAPVSQAKPKASFNIFRSRQRPRRCVKKAEVSSPGVSLSKLLPAPKEVVSRLLHKVQQPEAPAPFFGGLAVLTEEDCQTSSAGSPASSSSPQVERDPECDSIGSTSSHEITVN